jgi:hypothetical protein
MNSRCRYCQKHMPKYRYECLLVLNFDHIEQNSDVIPTKIEFEMYWVIHHSILRSFPSPDGNGTFEDASWKGRGGGNVGAVGAIVPTVFEKLVRKSFSPSGVSRKSRYCPHGPRFIPPPLWKGINRLFISLAWHDPRIWESKSKSEMKYLYLFAQEKS